MKFYYYLLYRIYNYYRNSYKENEGLSLYSTVTVSTLIVYSILYTAFAYIDFYSVNFLNKIVTGKLSVMVLMVVIGLINYLLFIKDKNFLNYNFKADKKGGYTIIGFIFLLALIFIFITNENRREIFKEREKARIENVQ